MEALSEGRVNERAGLERFTEGVGERRAQDGQERQRDGDAQRAPREQAAAGSEGDAQSDRERRGVSARSVSSFRRRVPDCLRRRRSRLSRMPYNHV